MDKNMDKLQVKIGKILCLFSLVMFISRIIPCIIIPVLFKNNIYNYMALSNFRLLLYSLLFFVSFIYINQYTKILQLLLILLESIISLNSQPISNFFGLILIIAILILFYIYGFLNENPRIKLGIIAIIIYILFILFPLKDFNNKYILAFKWILFIFTFLICLWYLSSDYINNIKNKEKEEKDKLIELLKESNSIAKDAINACEKYFDKYNKDCL